MLKALSAVESVELISPSISLNKTGVYKARRVKVSENTELVQPFTIGTRTKIGRSIMFVLTQWWLFFYLLKHTKKGEQIVAYHSMYLITPLKLLKKLKKNKLILEVREIYSDVKFSYAHYKNPPKRKTIKEKKFFDLADKYIFPTVLLNDAVNKYNKPYVIASGVYLSEKRIAAKENDNIVHVVHAGSLAEEKGAFAAIKAAKHLDENFHIHVLGYGNEERIKAIRELIDDVKKVAKAEVTYDGLLRGDEFISFLQKCQIGLAVQDPSVEFTDTSFPSKVLTYLSNGLDVLSIRIPAVENSPAGKLIHFCDSQAPEEVADAIRKISEEESVDKIEALNKLHTDLISDLKDLWRGNFG